MCCQLQHGRGRHIAAASPWTATQHRNSVPVIRLVTYRREDLPQATREVAQRPRLAGPTLRSPPEVFQRREPVLLLPLLLLRSSPCGAIIVCVGITFQPLRDLVHCLAANTTVKRVYIRCIAGSCYEDGHWTRKRGTTGRPCRALRTQL